MNIIPRTLFPALQRALADQRVIVITGQRRVGKTTATRWLRDQAPTDNKLYLDLERFDQRAVFGESNYDLVLSFLRKRGLNLSRRFGNPELPFDISSHGDSQALFPALRAIPCQAVTDRAVLFAWRLAGAADIPPAEVPAFVEETIGQFLELCTAAETFPLPGGSVLRSVEAESRIITTFFACASPHDKRTPRHKHVLGAIRGAGPQAARCLRQVGCHKRVIYDLFQVLHQIWQMVCQESQIIPCAGSPP